MNPYRILNAADSALVVEFGATIDRGISDRVLALAETLKGAALPGVTGIVATFRSLSVNYDAMVTTGRELEGAIASLLKTTGSHSRARRLWHIPVCYDTAFAPDIEDVASATGLRPADVAELHAGVTYHVYMIGFVPGYPYMGGLPDKLHLPRRKDPRTRVPPGSVAIATSMTAVYPYESPGGWHLIGTTPVRFFDPESESGALLGPGDAVKFEPVTPARFSEINAAVQRNGFVPDSEEILA